MKKLLIIILTFSSLTIYSQKTIVTDRPDQTESALTVPFGAFQIESGLRYEWVGTYNEFNLFTLPTTLVRYGIIENLELRFQLDHYLFNQHSSTQSGFGDFSLGLKGKLYSDENTDMAFIAIAVIPSGNEYFRNPRTSFTGLFSISHILSDAVNLAYNFGINYDPYKNVNFIYSVATGFSLTENLSTFVEVFGTWHRFMSTSVSFDLGFTYLLNNNLQLDASFGKGINYKTNFLSLGLSWRILPN